ncbi:MAG: 50S ribosomal protein L15 [Nanoarchaeota archaeon]|nr:50S ribosomal protein L15 [Nanoarchaeota archaeon]
MVTFKRKKVTKYRGSKTHGGGAMKKRRGAGNRGGRGNAGSGKRADQKKESFLKIYGKDYFGKKGFKSKYKKEKIINLQELENKLEKLLKKNLIKKEKDTYIINLKELNYNKLLGSGKIFNKYQITVDSFSKKAKEKVEKLGGKINVSV